MSHQSSRDFRLIRPAGALFQADLFLAERQGAEGFTKQVTLWQVRSELCQGRQAVSFLLEDLKLAAQLTTSQITQVLDVWREEQRIIVAVEHMSGLTLAQVLQRAVERQRRLSVEFLIALILEVARALTLAHEPQLGRQAVIHGDLRPQNVLLGKEGAVKLTGFGYRRFLAALEPAGQYCTWDGWCYQPRERLEVGPADPRSDLFSLGLVLYEAVTGLRPWGLEPSAELLEAVGEGRSPIAEQAKELPADLGAVLRRACAVDPVERFQSMGELSEALEGLLAGRGRGGLSTASIRELLETFSDSPAAPEVAEAPGECDEETSVDTLVDGRSPPRRQAPRPPVAPPAHRLVGQRVILRTIGRALAATARGLGSNLLLTGNPGMGRTRILTEISLRLCSAEQRRAFLLVRPRPAERAVRLSGQLRLLAALAGLEPDTTLASIGEQAERLESFGLDHRAIEAVRVVCGEGLRSEPTGTMGLLSEAVIQAVTRLAQEQPTVIAWDDLQWTDEASLVCLGELLTQLPSMAVLALLTASSDFEVTWRAVELTRLDLRPLSSEESEKLIVERLPPARRVEPDLLDGLVSHASGNPLVIEEVLALMRRADRLMVKRGEVRLVPEKAGEPLPSLEEGMRARLSEMDKEAYLVAVASALAGPALDLEVLTRATALESAVVEEALQALEGRHQVLRRAGGSLSFVHERHRRALLVAATPSIVERLREPVARAIVTSSSTEAGLDDFAASLLIEAGEEAAAAELLSKRALHREELGSVEGALSRFQRAAKLARSSGSLGLEFELQQELGVGRSAFAALRFDLAERSLRRAARLAEHCDAADLGIEATNLLLQLLARQGKLKAVTELAKDAIPLVESTGDPALMARAYGAIGEAYQQWGQLGPDLRYIEAAVSFATEGGDSSQLGHLLHLAVMHAAGVGEEEQTRILLDQARPIVAASDDLAVQGNLIKVEALQAIFSRDWSRAIERATEGLMVARRGGLYLLEVVMLHHLGESYLRMGHGREALFHLTESLRRAKASGFDKMIELNEMYVGYIEAVHLDMVEGLSRLKAALESASAQGRLWSLEQGHELLGRALLHRGEPGQAMPHLAAANRFANESGVRFLIDESTRALSEAER